MAGCGRMSVARLCVCSVVVMLLLLGDGAAALGQEGERATGVVASTEGFYLRGNPTVPSKDRREDLVEESFESFARRELDDGYATNPASANCDTNNTNEGCTP